MAEEAEVASVTPEYSKMKLPELRKELKARGLPGAGSKAELVARLEEYAAVYADPDPDPDLGLDSDLDSDGVLEDDPDHDIILDESVVSVSSHPDPGPDPGAADKPKLKRKSIAADVEDTQTNGSKETPAKKIILHRPASIPSLEPKTVGTSEKPVPIEINVTEKKPSSLPADPKDRLKLRAERFNLPMTEEERKEARKIRFGQTGGATTDSVALKTSGVADYSSIDKLKKRAERFGQSVSKIMTNTEAQEKLEKRKAKFGLVK